MDGYIGGEVTVHQVLGRDRVSRLVIGDAAPVNGCQFTELAQTEFMHILGLDKVFIRYQLTAIKVGNDHSLVDNMFDSDRCEVRQALRKGLNCDVALTGYLIQVVLAYLWTLFVTGRRTVH